MIDTPPREWSFAAGGYVLAGGRSSRMGRDKSRLPWGQSTLIEMVAAEVAAVTGSVATVGGEPIPGIRYVADPLSGYGPVAGIAAALRDSSEPWTLAVACDMPGITGAFLQRLLREAQGSEGAIPVTSDGRTHPLCAVWSTAAARETFDRALEAGEHTLRHVVRGLRCVFPAVDDPGLLRNVNTPEEYAEALAQGQAGE